MKTEPIFLQDTSGWSKAAASYLNRGPQPPSAEHVRLRLNILIDERS